MTMHLAPRDRPRGHVKAGAVDGDWVAGALRTLAALVLILGLSFGSGCSDGDDNAKARGLSQPGKLVVLTRNAPTTYYEGRGDELQGLEYELATAFAQHKGVEVEFKLAGTIAEILTGLRAGQAEIAAAGLTATERRGEEFATGPVYQEVVQQVVCRRGGRQPRNADELVKVGLAVAAESSYDEELRRLQQEQPELRWRVETDLDTEQLLGQVWERKIDCTIADSNIVAINRRYFPELVVAFDLTEPQPLTWLLAPHASVLQIELVDWLDDMKSSGELDRLLDKYYGFVEVFDYVDTRTFIRRIEQRLPKYELLFRGVAERHEMDWTLLAAQAYQESHWNPKARSPTGVRGMMMLTLATARELGVNSRLDADQSIEGGARYLDRLRERLPESVTEPDRTWIALAAYNVGMGHIHDARELAADLGYDPDRWGDLAQVLPLLAQKRYYRELKHGYARGYEPVRYVTQIRNYHDILVNSLVGDAGNGS